MEKPTDTHHIKSAQVSLIQVGQPSAPNAGCPTGCFDYSGTMKAPNSDDRFRQHYHKGQHQAYHKERAFIVWRREGGSLPTEVSFSGGGEFHKVQRYEQAGEQFEREAKKKRSLLGLEVASQKEMTNL
ncbi:hypothetical protein Salat_1737200 [Sesamum alatum]|uniref:Uncharacterized protein n=1 Tax=Sesamum alatum TaxID=300844 RepID=A0AAE2CKF2_9LAMI|nr:hypothetical protein Salat_1737200 [Sesamum alatum]